MLKSIFNSGSITITDRSSESFQKYCNVIRSSVPLSLEEEVELAKVIREGGLEGQIASERLVNANLKFVVSIAKQYKTTTLELPDLVSEGNIGLLKAAIRFDGTKGNKFISFAVWYIRQHIEDAIKKNDNMISIPNKQFKVIRQYYKMQQDMLEAGKGEITIADFCEATGNKFKTVISILESSKEFVQLDKMISINGEDCKATYGDFIESDSVTDSNLDEEALHSDLMHVIEQVLDSREAYIVKHISGIVGQPMSINEISIELNLSYERVRQIYNKALDKISKSPYSWRLAQHLAA